MQSAAEMMSRHANSSIYRLRPNHGVTFLDIEISASQLARVKACFVEERLPLDEGARTVLLPVDSDNMFDDGTAWHPETFQPLGPNEAIWLSGHQGISPFFGHWLPLPYLRMMTAKTTSGAIVDQGPMNWVRVFISSPSGPLHEASTFNAVLAIDTQLAGGSRLDQRRYNAPSLEDVSLNSTFVLTDDADQLAGLLTESWLNDWLQEILGEFDSNIDHAASGSTERCFDKEHIARYLFLLKVLCEACPAPILRFASQARERVEIETADNELILDLSDDVGLAVLVGRQATTEWSPDVGRPRVLPVRDLGQPTKIHVGALPIRVEFDTAPFGFPQISRQSGRSNAFNWSSLVRIGEEATRISLRPNAQAGTTGSASLARNAQDTTPIAGMWRNSSDAATCGKFSAPTRCLAMRYLAEDGVFIGARDDIVPALRPRFSRSSLLTLFIAELLQQAISTLSKPRKTDRREPTAAPPENLRKLRLSLPVSIDAAGRDAILARATESIEFVWRAQGWDDDPSGQAPPKPGVELGLGGDFGVQLIYLHDQLDDIYSGDLPALVEDLNPVRKPVGTTQQVVQFASVAIGFTTTRLVVADYNMVDSGSVRPRLVGTHTVPQGLDAIHKAVIDRYLVPAIGKALHEHSAAVAQTAVYEILGRPVVGQLADALSGSLSISVPGDLALRLEDKVLLPAARALLDIYSSSSSGGARGVERLTMAGLVERGGGRLEPLSESIDTNAAALGADGFRLADVAIPFSRHTFRKAALVELEAIVAAATSAIDVDQTDLVFVTSAYTATDDLRDMILSLVPISPHRLVILDDQWSAHQDEFGLPGQISVPIRVGVLSSVIGKRGVLDYDGLDGIEHTLQIESEVA